MSAILLMIAGALVGAILSWAVAHWYYRRSIVEMPEWAKKVPEWAIPLIQKLPDRPMTDGEAIARFLELRGDGH